MQRILWRLAAASGVAVSLAFGAGPVAASSSGASSPGADRVQVADQAARTEQDAESSAKSEQFLPVNANVPVQFLSLGHNGGDTMQSNNSTAKSNAENEAWTKQSVDQDQHVDGKGGYKGHATPAGPAFQGAEQSASTDQDATSTASRSRLHP